jgi:hypothetical protein
MTVLLVRARFIIIYLYTNDLHWWSDDTLNFTDFEESALRCYTIPIPGLPISLYRFPLVPYYQRRNTCAAGRILRSHVKQLRPFYPILHNGTPENVRTTNRPKTAKKMGYNVVRFDRSSGRLTVRFGPSRHSVNVHPGIIPRIFLSTAHFFQIILSKQRTLISKCTIKL